MSKQVPYGLAILVLALLPVGGNAQQPNSAAASMAFGGIAGPPYPILLPLNNQSWGSTLSFEIEGATNQPFLLASMPAGVLPSGLPTPFGLLDADPGLGIFYVMDGLGATPPNVLSLLATTGSSGVFSLTIPISAASPVFSEGLQAAVADPTNPAGITFTAATLLSPFSAADDALFVSHSRGNASNPGTSGFPFLTIQQAINAAFQMPPPRPTVKIEEGTYDEPGLTLRDGVSLIGGLDGFAFFPVPQGRSRVTVSTMHAKAESILLSTSVSGMEFVAADATSPGAASIALWIKDSGSSLSFTDCLFQSGRGHDGTDGNGGVAGNSGQSGGSGASGGNGGCGGIGGYCGGNGGDGGGIGGTGNFGNGGGGSGGGSGGNGGAGSFCSPNNGGTGGAGSNGAPGAAGVVGVLGGSVAATGVWSAGSGGASNAGEFGRGGGGGGGGGGATCNLSFGGHGGGGGQGGRGGSFAQGAESGGASFAVQLHSASPTFQLCTFEAGTGGDGGDGGNGAGGGTFGSGGPGDSGTNGANGGAGGRGGHGGSSGGGAGGHGGPSWGIHRSGASNPVLVSGITFITGAGGQPGTGGLGGQSVVSAAPGANGSVGPVGTMN